MHCHFNSYLTQKSRHRLVIQHLKHGRGHAVLATEDGYCLSCAYRWLARARYRSGGPASLADARSAPAAAGRGFAAPASATPSHHPTAQGSLLQGGQGPQLFGSGATEQP